MGVTKHGLKQHPVYQVWKGMRKRCNNPNEPGWKNYGGRGITICERWESAANFIADMGERPKGMTLERIDNTLGYSPENCKWATMKEQSLNKRNNRNLTFDGRTQCHKHWARELGIARRTLDERLIKYPIEIALGTPKRRRRER